MSREHLEKALVGARAGLAMAEEAAMQAAAALDHATGRVRVLGTQVAALEAKLAEVNAKQGAAP